MEEGFSIPGIAGAGPIGVDQFGDWTGDWHWPARISVATPRLSGQMLSKLSSMRPVERGHASVVPFAPYATTDLLIVDGLSDLKLFEGMSGQAGAVLIYDPEGDWTAERLVSLRRAAGIGAAIRYDGPRDMLPSAIGSVFTKLSHDVPLQEAFATGLSDGKRPSGFSGVVGASFVDHSLLSTTLDRTLGRLRDLGSRQVIVPPVVARELNLGRAVEERLPSVQLADALSGARHGVRFHQESQGATGAATVARVVEAKESGPTVRYADTAIYDAGRSHRLPSTSGLGLDRTYVLEFAFRAEPVGIGYDAAPRPLQAAVDRPTDLLVAVSAGKGSRVDFEQRVQKITIGSDGDSTAACFRFTPEQARDDLLKLEVRVFCNMNLVEIVRLQARVADEEKEHAEPVQQVNQPETFRRYQGALSEAPPPAALSIDVTLKEQGYELTFASADKQRDGLELVIRPALTKDDLKRQLGEIRDIWLGVTFDAFPKGLAARSPPSGKKQLERLAGAGRALWTLLFETGSPKDGSKVLGDALRKSRLPFGAKVSVSLDSNAREFVFPWQLLYDGDVGSPGKIDVDRFWGARYLIEQRLSVPVVYVPNAEPPVDVSMAMFLDGTIPQSAELQTWTEALGKASRNRLRASTIHGEKDLVGRLKAGDDGLLYFFCHGLSALPYSDWCSAFVKQLHVHARKDPSASEFAKLLAESPKLDGGDTALKLTRSLVKLADLLPLDAVFHHQPIVVLNMCESAQMFPDAGRGFVSFFLNRFAAAVLGTECPVPPDFGDALGRRLLPALLAGKQIGEVLLAIRREMLERHGNPLGLAYSLWGEAHARVAPVALDASSLSEIDLVNQ